MSNNEKEECWQCPFETLAFEYHEELGYHAEIPDDMTAMMLEFAGPLSYYCHIAAPDEIPCAENRAVAVFGKTNPHRIAGCLEGFVAQTVTIDFARWPYGEKGWSDAVDAVLLFGDDGGKKRDYSKRGLDESHIPELVNAACDRDLYRLDEKDARYWAYEHALLALGAFERIPHGAAEALAWILTRIDSDDDDTVSNLVPGLLAKIGEDAIPSILGYIAAENLQDSTPQKQNGSEEESEKGKSMPRIFSRVSAYDAIGKIGIVHPESRDQCVSELANALTRHAVQDATLNAFIISNLLDLKAVETLDLIAEAHTAGNVDEDIYGDIDDVRAMLDPDNPRPRPTHNWMPPEPYRRAEPKTGRNDPCPCGSGKKHKKCCIA
jgi:hypothetical protein